MFRPDNLDFLDEIEVLGILVDLDFLDYLAVHLIFSQVCA